MYHNRKRVGPHHLRNDAHVYLGASPSKKSVSPTRTHFVVRADLELMRKYEIRVQELPLLCRRLLERRDQEEPDHTAAEIVRPIAPGSAGLIFPFVVL
jgi:hypothetical protein